MLYKSISVKSGMFFLIIIFLKKSYPARAHLAIALCGSDIGEILTPARAHLAIA